MSELSTPPFVFLSYARADNEFVMRLKSDLRTQGIRVWIDQEGLEPGTPDWEEDVHAAICAAHVVLLIASPHARRSRYVKGELRIAEMYQRPVYPVWAAGNEWMEAVPLLSLSGAYYIDAREERYEAAMHDIVVALRKALHEAMPIYGDASAPSEDFLPRNPYKGLRAFTYDDARDFFGRQGLTNVLLEAVKEAVASKQDKAQSSCLLAVVGPSGSGKSSAVMAGLLPCLQQGALPESDMWVYLKPMKPGAHPLEELMLVLSDYLLAGQSMKALRDDLEEEGARGLYWHTIRLIPSPGAKVVLVVDQFEELFTQTSSEEERQLFIDLLVNAVTEQQSPVLVIITLRADFSDRPMQYSELSALIEAHRTLVLPMDIHDLRAVIEQPARLPDVAVTFEGDLVGDLLFEMRGQVGALPLLQFTLEQLFEHRNGHRLTLQAYRQIGGVKGALSKHAEETYAALPTEEHRTLARALFVRLIDLGATEQETTRRRAPLSEFALDGAMQTRLVRETMDAFISVRLLTANEIGGTPTIEISHEVLIREWPRLFTWACEAREDIRLQNTIGHDAAAWKQYGKPKDRLYRGSQLKDAQAWARRNFPSGNEIAFLQASTVQRKRSLASVIGLFCLFMLLAGTAVQLFIQLRSIHIPRLPDPTLVTTLKDDGPGSLRRAVALASTGTRITFDPSLRGKTILLTSGDLQVNKKNLAILGPDKGGITISGADKQVFVNEGASVTFTGVMFKNSHFAASGSAIANFGFLTLIDSIVFGNTNNAEGSGIFNSGTLTLINSTISGNTGSVGVGIANFGGKVTLMNSLVTGNTADAGGAGIDNSGTLILSNSTISGNRIISGFEGGGTGGGINNSGTLILTNSTISGNQIAPVSRSRSDGEGGGIYNSGTLILTNSTISDNLVPADGHGDGGGIANAGGQIKITFCTIYGNTADKGGGLAIFPKGYADNGQVITSNVQIKDSIIAGDHAHTGPDLWGPFTSHGYNLIQDVSSATFTKQSTDVFGDPHVDVGIDSTLSGGPPQMHALLSGSSAIDKIPLVDCQVKDIFNNQSRIFTDQRGVKRPQGSACDIGAYEYMPA